MAEKINYKDKHNQLNYILNTLYDHTGFYGVKEYTSLFELKCLFYQNPLSPNNDRLIFLINELKEDGYIEESEAGYMLTPKGTVFKEEGGFRSHQRFSFKGIIDWATNFNTIWDAAQKAIIFLGFIWLYIELSPSSINQIKEKLQESGKDPKSERLQSQSQPLDSIAPTKDTVVYTLDSANSLKK